jgi:hypothetical protein
LASLIGAQPLEAQHAQGPCARGAQQRSVYQPEGGQAGEAPQPQRCFHLAMWVRHLAWIFGGRAGLGAGSTGPEVLLPSEFLGNLKAEFILVWKIQACIQAVRHLRQPLGVRPTVQRPKRG